MNTAPLSTDDRRREPRQGIVGEVRFRQAHTPAIPFIGQLMDVAVSGFRAHHYQFALGSGELVDFEFHGHSGLARAMWTRIVDDHVETGFRICQENGSADA